MSSIYDVPKDPFHEHGWACGAKGNCKAAVRVHVPNPPDQVALEGLWSQTHALVQAGPKNNDSHFLRIEWNPAANTASQTDHLLMQFDPFFGLKAPDILKARVTRLDWAIDVPGMKPGDYVWERPKSPLRNLTYRKGCLEILYLGTSFKGQVAIYGKAKEQGALRANAHSRGISLEAQTNGPRAS